MTSTSYKIDFGEHKSADNWQIMNDGVMGGLSQSTAYFTENTLQFQGTISLANNGGFASVRSPWQRTDLSTFSKVKVRYKATEQSTSIVLESNRMWWQPYYLLALQPTDGEWVEVTLSLSDFKEIKLVQSTGKSISKTSLKNIIRIGFMTINKKAGSFGFEVDYVEFY